MTFAKTFWAVLFALLAAGFVAWGGYSWANRPREIGEPSLDLTLPPMEREAPSLFNSVPKTVTLTVNLARTSQDGSPFTLPAGTVLDVIERVGNNYAVRYGKEEFVIEKAVTSQK